MAGRVHERHARVAERDLLPVGRDDVARGLALRIGVLHLVEPVPIRAAQHDARLEAVLHHARAADVVAVAVADDDGLHVGRIEPELLQAADDRLLRIVVVERVDQDDAFARGQRPGRMDARADEVEIVEHLAGLGVPLRARRRRRRRDVAAGRGLRRDAEADERAGEIESGRCLGRREMPSTVSAVCGRAMACAMPRPATIASVARILRVIDLSLTFCPIQGKRGSQGAGVVRPWCAKGASERRARRIFHAARPVRAARPGESAMRILAGLCLAVLALVPPAAAQPNYDSWPVLQNPFESTGGGGIMIGEYRPVVFGKFCTTNFTATTPKGEVYYNGVDFDAVPVAAARCAPRAAGVRSTAAPTARRRCEVFIKDGVCAVAVERCGRDVQVIRHLRRRAGLLVDDAAARDPAGMLAPLGGAPRPRVVLGLAAARQHDAGRAGGDRDNDGILHRGSAAQVLHAAGDIGEHAVGRLCRLAAPSLRVAAAMAADRTVRLASAAGLGSTVGAAGSGTGCGVRYQRSGTSAKPIVATISSAIGIEICCHTRASPLCYGGCAAAAGGFARSARISSMVRITRSMCERKSRPESTGAALR